MSGGLVASHLMLKGNSNGYRMGRVNSYGESRAFGESFRVHAGRARRKNGRIPGRLRDDPANGESVAHRRLGEGRGTVVKPSLRDISMAYNNIFPGGNVGNRGFSKVPQARRCAAARRSLAGPRAGRQHHCRGAPRARHRRSDPRERIRECAVLREFLMLSRVCQNSVSNLRIPRKALPLIIISTPSNIP